MKRIIAISCFTIFLGLQSFIMQQEPEFSEKDEKLFKEHKCRLCHKIEKDRIGPAYIAVAKKYKNDDKALQKLKASIKAGGSGKWGDKEMRAYPDLPDSTLTRLATAILNLSHQ